MDDPKSEKSARSSFKHKVVRKKVVLNLSTEDCPKNFIKKKREKKYFIILFLYIYLFLKYYFTNTKMTKGWQSHRRKQSRYCQLGLKLLW